MNKYEEQDGHVIDEKTRQEAQAIIERAKSYKGLITVLTRRLEQFDDPVARSAAAELRNDPHWRWFTRGSRDDRRKRKIARKSRKGPKKRKTFRTDERALTITRVLSPQDTQVRMFMQAHEGRKPVSLEELNAWLVAHMGRGETG